MQKMIEALEAELVILNRRWAITLEEAKRRVEEAVAWGTSSGHFAHNLGNNATELASIAAKIEQTQMILSDMKARVALEGQQPYPAEPRLELSYDELRAMIVRLQK